VAAAVGLVAVYFGIAAVAHLMPFTSAPSSAVVLPSSQASTPGESQQGSADSSSSSSSSSSSVPIPDRSAPASSPAQALLDMIPGSVRSTGCRATPDYAGAIAVRQCTGVSYGSGTPNAAVIYYLFADDTALNQAYADYLKVAKMREGTGNCGGFKSYLPPCETAITNAKINLTGRAAEFIYKGKNGLISTYAERNLLVYIAAPDGSALLKWWLFPGNWVTRRLSGQS
jgi:hypothetical protein